MNAKDAIKRSMDTSSFVLKTYISDISDADLMIRPAKGANHLAWQLGHLVSSECQLLNAICPGASAELPAGFHDQHSKGTTPLDDAAKFLKKGQYLELYDQQRRATRTALEKLPEADLDKPGPKNLEKIGPTVGAIFLLIANHALMHSGQFATVRRLLGKPVLI